MNMKEFSIERPGRRIVAIIVTVLVTAVGLTVVAVNAAHSSTAVDVRYRFAGYAEVANGESAALSIANVSSSTCQADLLLVNTLNNPVKVVNGLTVAPGQGALMTFPDVTKGRMRLRPVVVSVNDTCTAFQGNLEVFNTTSKVTTQAVQYANPEG